MDVTRERISHILELTEILLSIQTGFSLVNAAVVCAILESISGSGLTSDYNDNKTEEFYDQLQNVIDQTPKKDILVVQGDWNAKVGSDACGNWQGIRGSFCNEDTNERTQTSGAGHL